jgi:hypothetical protein
MPAQETPHIRHSGPKVLRLAVVGAGATGADMGSLEGIMQLKKAYLTLASVAVAIIALLYGISPTWYAATFLGITDLNPNVAHILRAVTGLYLALAAFWLYSAFNDKYRNTAVLTTILFAGGLAAGRCVSLIVDGQPAPVLLIYGAMEFAVVLIGYWVFRLPER